MPKQSQSFSHYKLSTLAQRLSQVNVAGIYLLRELEWNKSSAKTPPYSKDISYVTYCY